MMFMEEKNENEKIFIVERSKPWLSMAHSITCFYISKDCDKELPSEFQAWQKEVNSWCKLVGEAELYAIKEPTDYYELEKPAGLDDDDNSFRP